MIATAIQEHWGHYYSLTTVTVAAEVSLENPNHSMAFKRNLVLSLLLGIGGGLGAYVLAWGLFTTHPELGMEVGSALSIAVWTAPLIFVGSLVYFAVRKR
jgi:hypothetical protein